MINKEKLFSTNILKWHKNHNRNFFFWRNTRNPYHILVAEIMLQKTTARQVQGIFEEFLAKFPNVYDLSEASIENIEDVIKPLGLEHIRAKRLKKIAILIVEEYGGNIPSEKNELLALPGLGRYIVNSIQYLAFDKAVPIVDTNIVRILQRVFDLKTTKARARTDEKFWLFVKKLMPKDNFKEFNLALLDHGALICTAKKPEHNYCPVKEICNAYMKNRI